MSLINLIQEQEKKFNKGWSSIHDNQRISEIRRNFVKFFIVTIQKQIIEKIKKECEERKRDRDHENIPDYMEGRVTDYQNGFDDALSTITTYLDNVLKQL